MKDYWVYIPEVNEAGCVVNASDLVAAYKKGSDLLHPEDGVSVVVTELGPMQSFVAGDD